MIEAHGLVKRYGSTMAVDDLSFSIRKNKPESQNQANRAHAKLRAPGERANAQLKSWKILARLRCCPWRAGQLAKAIHALQIHGA